MIPANERSRRQARTLARQQPIAVRPSAAAAKKKNFAHACLVAQVLFPTKDIGDLQTWYGTEEDTLSTEAKSIICKTLARKRMQVFTYTLHGKCNSPPPR